MGYALLPLSNGKAAERRVCKYSRSLEANQFDTGTSLIVRRYRVEQLKAAALRVAARFHTPVHLVAAFAFVVGTFSYVPQATAANLKEELLLLLQQHPQLKAGKDNVAAASEGVNFASSLFLPTVSLNGDSGYKIIDNPTSRAAGKNFGRGFEKLTLTVTQNIFDGSRKNHDKNTAELNQEAVAGSFEETRQSLLLQAANIYVDVLRQIALTRLARKSESAIAYQLDLEDERVKRGGGTAVDVLLSKTRLQRSKEQRIVFEGNLRDAVTRYTQLFGHPPDLKTLETPKLDYVLVPTDIDAAVSAALAANPLIANSNRQIDIARMRQRSAQSDYFPRVDVVGSANYEDDREGTVGNRRDYSVTLQATWNLFSGFSTRSSVAEAAHSYSATINNHLFVNRRIEEEVRLAWQSMLTACDRRLLLVNAVLISAEVHASRVRLQEAGQETTINVLDAEGEVFNAEINEVAAVYDEVLAIYRLASAQGLNLVDILDLEYSPEVNAKAKEHYEDRCIGRLQTVAHRTTEDAAQKGAANPFGTPAKGEDGDEAANPFAAPAEEDGEDDEDENSDEKAANPFAAPSNEDESEEAEDGASANPFAAKSQDDVETEDDGEASTSNPFAEKSGDDENGTDDDDGLSLKKKTDVLKKSSIEDEIEEDDDDSISRNNPVDDEESENEAVRELETEEDDEPVTDDKVSTLVLPQSQKTATEKTDTEWDDDLKKTTQ